MADLAPVDVAAPILELAERAAHTPGSAGLETLSHLHTALSTLMPTEANGSALLQLLDDGQLRSLRTEDGTATREVAIQTLLRLGYPWAVQIRAEDLAWYREQQSTRQFRKVLVFLGLLVATLLGAGVLYRLA